MALRAALTIFWHHPQNEYTTWRQESATAKVKLKVCLHFWHHPQSPRFIPSASPVMSRLTASFTCQLISVIITTLIHHSFTLSLQAQNLPFQQILLSLILLRAWTVFTITGPDRTYRAFRFIFSSFLSLIFLFVPCDGLSWLHVSFLLHVKYTISYRIVHVLPLMLLSYYCIFQSS